MEGRGNSIIKHLDIIRRGNPGRELLIAETGTIRRTDDRGRRGDGHSTEYIARWVKQDGNAQFYSIDIDTEVCFEYMVEKGLSDHVELVEDDSLVALSAMFRMAANSLLKFDFVYLDSANNPNLTLSEFKLCEEYGVPQVMIDDCKPPKRKGSLAIEYAQEQGIPCAMNSDGQGLFFMNQK